MKIGYLTYHTDPKAGWGRHASDLIRGAEQEGFKTVILKEHNDQYPGLRILSRGMGVFWSALKALRYLRDCDIIHALDVYPYGVIAWVANIFLRKPLIITGVGTYTIAPFYNWKTRWLVRRACRTASVITAISSFTARELGKASGRTDIVVVNPGIEFEKFHRSHKQSHADMYLLSVGALKRRKGFHISLEAFAGAKKQFPGLRYIIVGSQHDKGYFADLKDLARSLGVLESIEFLSGVTDERLAELYQGARLFILTSINEKYHCEGFGIVFLEAAAAGTPAIGTRGNGIEDAVKDGYNGFLVPQNDISTTADAIGDIIGNPARWEVMSRASYEWAQKHDTSHTARHYQELYRRLIS